MRLQRLYKQTKLGKVQVHDIVTAGDTITVSYGESGGKLQHQATVCYGKNIGRSNETTANSQALTEATAKWHAKQKSGYVLDPTGRVLIHLPMRIKNYHEQMNNVVFPCRVMTKYNGVNGTHRTDFLTSRGGEDYDLIPHLASEVAEMLSVLETTSLGCEVYIHGQHLQDITSAVKKPKDLSKSLELRVFGLPDSDKTFGEVCDLLNKAPSLEFVKPCRSVTANSHEELDALHAKAVELGFEGLVIYNEKGTYQYNTRSSDAFKYKIALDAEFKIQSMTVDKNGNPKFLMEYIDVEGNTDTFSVTPKGTSEERKAMIPVFDTEYKGMWYTVEYEMLSKIGKPLKGIGLGLRICDPISGEPLE